MEQNIFEVIEKLRRTEEDLYKARERLRNKKDSLHLYSDWDNLKKEKGISNDTKRNAHVNEIVKDERKRVDELEVDRNYFERVYNAMLHEQPQINPATEPVRAK